MSDDTFERRCQCNDGRFEFCGGISYDTRNGPVGSDLCMHSMKFGAEERQFLHDCLDEWLDKSNGTGSFWLGDSDLTEEDDGELNKAMDRLERMTKQRDNLLRQRDEVLAMCDGMMSIIDKQLYRTLRLRLKMMIKKLTQETA